MNRYARMMLMRNGRGGDRGGNRGGDRGGIRNEYESRFRDRDGREHYDDSRFAPMNYVESRFRDRDGREHYDNGRFAPMRNEYNGYNGYDMRYDGGSQNYYPTVPPMYRSEGGRPMNKIGFALEGEMGRMSEYQGGGRSTVEYPRNDEMSRRGGMMEAGRGESDRLPELTKERALEWAKQMKNEDGTTGAHWTMEQTTQVLSQNGLNLDPNEFFLVMNMMYSDYSKVFKRYGIDRPEIYAELAKAWIDDPDAKKDKTVEYFCHAVKHS